MVELDGVYVFNITSPFSLPVRAKDYIEDEFGSSFEGLGEKEAIFQLFDLDIDLIYLYQDLSDEIFAAAMPEFRNMDGKELIFTKSTYEFNPSDRTVIINTLSKIGEFEFEVDAEELDDLFVWVDEPDNPSLMDHVVKGRIEIGKRHLKTDCNSAERDNQLRSKLMAVLNGLITHRKTASEPLDMSRLADRAEGELSGQETGVLNLEDLPEDARAELIEHMEDIYMKWADTPVPVLDDKTPREAVKSDEGKKQVISLLIDWENSQSRVENPQFAFDFSKLRKALGLPLE